MTDPGHLHAPTYTTGTADAPTGTTSLVLDLASTTTAGGPFTATNTTGLTVKDSEAAGSVFGTPAPYVQLLVCQKS